MTPIIVIVVGLVVVAVAHQASRWIGVASALVLLAAGVALGQIDAVARFEVEPEWVLSGLLPPLLYAAAVSMPTMDLRREMGAVSGLSVVLVLITAGGLGALLSWMVPGLSLPWAIALGAILSPTDAVATTIAKRVDVTSRVTTMLEGESLLNDATALVVLHTAIVATAASVTVAGVAGRFGYSLAVAIAIGLAVGIGNLRVRSRVAGATENTVISLTVPFLASIPAELLGASGLVAAVVAGLVTGWGAAAKLPAEHRLSDGATWGAVEMILEGAVFLYMGTQLHHILDEVHETRTGLDAAIMVSILALAAILAVRGAYVAMLLAGARRRHRRRASTRPRRQRWRSDLDFLIANPLGWREGTVVVWAGMRGAVTVAAAETLPADTPQRPVFIFVAFTVAATSLVMQGVTLAPLVRWVRPATDDPTQVAVERAELARVLDEVGADARQGGADDGAVAAAQRDALLAARDEGTYGSAALNAAMLVLTADEIRARLVDPEDDRCR